MEEQETAEVPPSPPVRRTHLTLVIAILGALVFMVAAGLLVTHAATQASTDAQVESQIASLRSITPTPAPLVSLVPSSTVSPPIADTPQSATPPSPQPPASAAPVVPASKAASLPIGLTCPRAGITSLAILPLPPQANPEVVDPPETPLAAYWNPRWGKVGQASTTTALIQAHFAIYEVWPFNKLSYAKYFDVGDTCTVTTDDGSVLTYRLESTVALTMDQWRADPRFGNLVGPSRGFDMILQACDASDYNVLKRLVGFKLVAST